MVAVVELPVADTAPPGWQGPIALRVHCGLPGEGFDVTEAGTQKRLAVWIVRNVADVDRIASLGPDALALTREEFAALLAGTGSRIKTLLTDQRIISGIGNAYSDEILHTAKLSPFATAKSLDAEAVERLWVAIHAVLSDAIVRLEGQEGRDDEVGEAIRAARARPHRDALSGLRDTVREVSFADRSFQYCPTCQTGGKVLADRRMSRLLK